MPKRLNALVIAIIFVATSACSFFQAPPRVPGPPPPPARLFIASEVLQSMFEIAREYDTETVKCLTGFVNDGTVTVMSMEPAWINRADAESVSFRACNYSDTIGWMHNHPGYFDDFGAPVDVCAFSDRDIATTDGLAFPVAIVVCDATTIVWRFARDHRVFKWSGMPPAPPEEVSHETGAARTPVRAPE